MRRAWLAKAGNGQDEAPSSRQIWLTDNSPTFGEMNAVRNVLGRAGLRPARAMRRGEGSPDRSFTVEIAVDCGAVSRAARGGGANGGGQPQLAPSRSADASHLSCGEMTGLGNRRCDIRDPTAARRGYGVHGSRGRRRGGSRSSGCRRPFLPPCGEGGGRSRRMGVGGQCCCSVVSRGGCCRPCN